MGLSSSRKTSVWQTEDPGAIPGSSTIRGAMFQGGELRLHRGWVGSIPTHSTIDRELEAKWDGRY